MTAAELAAELLSDHASVRTRFTDEFTPELKELAAQLHRGFSQIETGTRRLRSNARAAWIESALLASFNNLLVSSQLLISGHIQPSGNMMRAFGEACALALLVSHPATGVLERVEEEGSRFPVQKALAIVAKKENLSRLGIDPAAWREFASIADWYDSPSHASVFSIAAQRDFSQPGKIAIGSHFDPAKLDAYRKEISLRTSAARSLQKLSLTAIDHALSAQAGD